MAIGVGKKVPTLSLDGSNGKKVSLADFKGKNVVLYFYPKDDTSGCTAEACDFRDRLKDFTKLNAVIVGVSPDSVASHEKFAKKHGLPFLLLADTDQELSKKFDVWKKKSMYGKEYMGVERSTFVIDENGVIVKEWRKVKVEGHVEEALSFIKENL